MDLKLLSESSGDFSLEDSNKEGYLSGFMSVARKNLKNKEYDDIPKFLLSLGNGA